jgi:RNA polymerase sigma-70 factor (ECF subfamily)
MSGNPGSRPPGAFAELYQRCASLVARRARQILGDEQSAQDATQEVFMRVLDTFPDLTSAAPNVSWLYQVTTNHCLNVLRDRRRRTALLHEQNPRAGASEIETPIRLLLSGVPDHLHEVGIYYYVDEMSQQEIAILLGVSQRRSRPGWTSSGEPCRAFGTRDWRRSHESGGRDAGTTSSRILFVGPRARRAAPWRTWAD